MEMGTSCSFCNFQVVESPRVFAVCVLEKI